MTGIAHHHGVAGQIIRQLLDLCGDGSELVTADVTRHLIGDGT